MAIITTSDVETYLGADTGDTTVALVTPWANRLAEQFVGCDLSQSTYTEYYPRNPRRSPTWDDFVDADVTAAGFHVGAAAAPGQDVLYLKHSPVKLGASMAQISVWEDYDGYAGQGAGTPFDTDTLLTAGDDYVADTPNGLVSVTGKLFRLAGNWPSIVGSVKVTYIAGYSANELAGTITDNDDYVNAVDLKMAVILIASKAYHEATAWSSTGTGLGGVGPLTSERLADYAYTMDSSMASRLFGLSTGIPLESREILAKYRNYGAIMLS